MNKDVKTKWLAKLREPNRKQTQGRLQDDNGQCCLGVLCEAAVEANVIQPAYRDDFIKAFIFATHTANLPDEVMHWAELEGAREIAVVVEGQPVYLSTLNDEGASFEEIADIIENNL